ncbi:uncharacterized protein ISCGN_015144 [Ixodes scapularis]
MVVRNECDLLVGPATPLLDRFSALEPLPQYFLSETGHCGGLLNHFITNVFGYVNAFDSWVWAGVFGSMMALSLLVALIDARLKCSALGSAYYHAFLDLFSIFLMEASPRVTRSSVKRWIIGTWWLAVLVLTSGFTGHMKASLTMKDEGGRLDTVHDIVVRPDVVPVIIKGTLFVELFRGTLDKDQQVVWARANRMKSIIPPKQVFTRETFDDVLLGKKVVFLEPSLFYYAVSNLYKSLPRGEFYLARERITNITMGMWINRGLPFKLRKALHQR